MYDHIKENQTIAYTMDDGRKAAITFTKKGEQTLVEIVFDPESENPIEMQEAIRITSISFKSVPLLRNSS